MFRLIINFICKCIPVKKGLYVFASNPYKSDNSASLFDCLSRMNLKGIKLRWVWMKFNSPNSKDTKRRFFRLRLFLENIRTIYLSARAEKIFYTHGFRYVPEKKKQTLYLLWHGTPFKKFKGSLIANNNRKNLIFVAPSKFSLSKYAENNGELLDLNRCLCFRHFRTDNFLNADVEGIKRAMGLSSYRCIVLGCFTWRRNLKSIQDEFGLLPMFSKDFLISLDSKLKEKNYLLLVKPHPMQKVAEKGASNFSNIRFVYDEDLDALGIHLYDLLSVSDALLSDYSSIVFDYCLLQKPIGHVLIDFDEFSKNAEEGVIYEDPKDYLPGSILKTQDQVKSFIEEMDGWKPNEHYRKVTVLFNDAERVVDSSSEQFCVSELFRKNSNFRC